MKFKDLFVPRYLNSDPNVRMKFVKNSEDIRIVKQMSYKDSDDSVRKAAADRIKRLQGEQRTAS